MKPSLDKSKVSFSFSGPPEDADYSFYEYHWDGPRRQHVPVWQPRQTTLFVVFDGETRHLFSSTRILLYSSKDIRSGNVWDLQQLGPMIHSFRGQAEHANRNEFHLPKLTIALEVVIGSSFSKSSCGVLVLRPPTSIQDLRRSAITVLLEREIALTSDTLSLSLSFAHSTMLCTTITPSGSADHPSLSSTHPASRIEVITTRIVRVLLPNSVRTRRIANSYLPAELLIKIFKDAEFRHTWQDDLLSFAQVCRAWSCAMDVLHARLTYSDEDKRSYSKPLLDVYALARAVREKPCLALGFYHFTTDNVGKQDEVRQSKGDESLPPARRKLLLSHSNPNPIRFTAALITILGATRNVQRLHLGRLDPSQADALFNVLHELGRLHTFSIGPVEDPRSLGGLIRHPRGDGPTRILSVVQLARCMARWPALTSLKVHHLHPGMLGLWRFALRPPACALTQLVLCRSHLSDRDLVHLFASSGRTLERVVLDRIQGVTNPGLVTFLLAIAQNVTCLTVQDVALPPFQQWGQLIIGRMERALDVVVDRMPRLQELRVGGDVASEFMLDRRSKMFVACNNTPEDDGMRPPVVRLWLEDVPRLCGFIADGKWPGWCTPGKAPPRR